MTPREELVYKLRNEGMVYRLIGEQLGVSKERARQIYEKIQRRLRRTGKL